MYTHISLFIRATYLLFPLPPKHIQYTHDTMWMRICRWQGFEDMQQAGCLPNEGTWVALITAHARKKRTGSGDIYVSLLNHLHTRAWVAVYICKYTYLRPHERISLIAAHACNKRSGSSDIYVYIPVPFVPTCVSCNIYMCMYICVFMPTWVGGGYHSSLHMHAISALVAVMYIYTYIYYLYTHAWVAIYIYVYVCIHAHMSG